MTAEVEVVADDDHLRVEAVDEHTLDEGLGRLRRLVLVEGHDDDGVEAGRGEQLHLLFGARQQPRRRLGPDHGGRVAIERDHHRHGAERLGPLTDVVDDGLVPEVYPVVGTDGDHGAAAGPGRRVEIGDGLHPPEATRLTDRTAI